MTEMHELSITRLNVLKDLISRPTGIFLCRAVSPSIETQYTHDVCKFLIGVKLQFFSCENC